MPLCKAFICSKSIYPFLFCEDLFCFWVLPHTCQYDYTESFLRTQVNLVLSMHVPKMNEYIRRFIWTSSWLILFQPSDSLFRCQQTRNSIVTNSMYNPPSSSYHWFKSTYQLAYTAAYTIYASKLLFHIKFYTNWHFTVKGLFLDIHGSWTGVIHHKICIYFDYINNNNMCIYLCGCWIVESKHIT